MQAETGNTGIESAPTHCAQTEARSLRSEIESLHRRCEALLYLDRDRMEEIMAACVMMELQMDLDELAFVDVHR